MLRYPVTSSLITYWSVAIDLVSSRIAGDCDLSFTQYRIIRNVSGEEGVGATSLARDLVLSQAQVRRMMVELEKRGLLMRISKYGNAYSSLAALTKQGHAILEKSSATAASTMMEFMLPAKDLFDYVTTVSKTWIKSGLDTSSGLAATSSQRGLDIGDVIRLGIEGAAKMGDLLGRRYRKQGISKLEYRILLALEENGGVLTASVLADELLCALSNVSSALKSLAMRGFVNLQKSPRDKRVTIADLTSEGFRFCRAITQEIDDFLMSLDVADSPEIRQIYIEISRICIDAERDRRKT